MNAKKTKTLINNKFLLVMIRYDSAKHFLYFYPKMVFVVKLWMPKFVYEFRFEILPNSL